MKRYRSSPHTMIEGVPELAALGEENRRTYSHGSISFHIPMQYANYTSLSSELH